MGCAGFFPAGGHDADNRCRTEPACRASNRITGFPMSSVTTNPAALAALTILRGVNKDLATVQEQASSGYRVENSKRRSDLLVDGPDDAVGPRTVFPPSQTRSASEPQRSIPPPPPWIRSSISSTQIQAKLVSAKEPGTDKSSVNSDIQQLKNQLQSVTQSASFSGENWLYNTDQQPGYRAIRDQQLHARRRAARSIWKRSTTIVHKP